MKKFINKLKKRTKNDRKDKVRKLPKLDGPSLDEAQEELLGDITKIKNVTENLASVCHKFQQAYHIAQQKYNCLQFQLIQQDLESIIRHVIDLRENGPKEAHQDIPLSESVMDEEIPEGYTDTPPKTLAEVHGLPKTLPKEMVEDAMEAARSDN